MNNQVLEESVAKARELMQDLTPLDIEYIERYIASCRQDGRLHPSSSVIKGNADDITESLRRCAQNDMMDGFSNVITLEIFYDPITYSELDPPYANRPMVRLNLLNPQRGLFRPHDILRSQDAYILVTHRTPNDEQ